MTHGELIARAKEYVREFINETQVDPEVIEGTARVRDVVIIYFGEGADPNLAVTIDKETGDFISAEMPD